MSSEDITRLQKSLFSDTFLWDFMSFLVQKNESNWNNKDQRDI